MTDTHDTILIVKDACAWPNLIRIDEKTIGAVIFNRPSHGLQEGSLELWRMDIENESWSHLSTPAPSLPGQNRMHSCCGVSSNGTIHILSTGFTVENDAFVRLEPVWHSCSNDNGLNWKITRNITVANTAPHVIPHGSMIFRDNGEILATVYCSFGKGNKSYTWCIVSNDEGSSWKMHTTIGDGDTNEAYLLELADSTLAAVRTHKDHHTRLFSLTKGEEEWRDREHLTLPMQHPGHLLMIEKKILLFTFGIRNKGLMGIGGRFSLDSGNSWLPPFVLHQFPKKTKDCGYPSTIQINGEKAITAYYTDLSAQYTGYQFGMVTWNPYDYLSKHQLESISDGRKMVI